MSPKQSVDLDTALDVLPLDPIPAGFTLRTMQRVRQLAVERQYRGLRFEDVVLPAFLALFLLMLMIPGLLAAYVLLNADSIWAQTLLLDLRYQVLRLSAGTSWMPLAWVSLTALGALMLAGLLGLWVWGSATPYIRHS